MKIIKKTVSGEIDISRKECLVCKKHFIIPKSRFNKAKYCSRVCKDVMFKEKFAKKGMKRPHTKEWEQNRLKAVRIAAKKKVWKRGYKRPIEHILPALIAARKWAKENPDKSRAISIANLPKNLSKEKNGNWKGGATEKYYNWRANNLSKLNKARKIVLERDGYKCKICGSDKNLEFHHIVPLKEFKQFATLRMNGVTLCRSCHQKTDSLGAKSSKLNEYIPSGTLNCVIRVVPAIFQEYPTAGNYQISECGTTLIFITEQVNRDYEFLISIHEQIECFLTKLRGIKEKDIMKFDLAYEKKRRVGDNSEPGDDKSSPYRKEHQFATMIEKIVAHELGIDWNKYESEIIWKK